MKDKLKKGDKVKIINSGGLYSTYYHFINKYFLPYKIKWKYGERPKDTEKEFILIGIEKHETLNSNIALIQDQDTKQVFLYNVEGLEKVDKFTGVRFYQFGKCICEIEYKIEKKEILDEIEKEYLRAVIKPFRNRVKCIIKGNFGSSKEFIRVDFNDNGTFFLPPFKAKKMYKGMENSKKYTLEELGL